jgi:methylenetetrahydrofolate reductase (NADPH)
VKHGSAAPSRAEGNRFAITVEVVPPIGPDAGPLLTTLQSMSGLPFDGFSVATNPVAKPRMSALALSSLIQQRTGKPATLHCTTRDHNRLSIQGLLWGARALGIESVLVATGDYVAMSDGGQTTSVRDVGVYALVRMARQAGLYTGVVLDPRPESNRLEHEVRRLEQKVMAGAQFVVTQPVYDEEGARLLYDATKHLGIPVTLGILPLRTARHAWFLHRKVSGIVVPPGVRERMELAADPQAEGIAGAREMLDSARQWFAGACIMPPFDHYDILADLLAAAPSPHHERQGKAHNAL